MILKEKLKILWLAFICLLIVNLCTWNWARLNKLSVTNTWEEYQSTNNISKLDKIEFGEISIIGCGGNIIEVNNKESFNNIMKSGDFELSWEKQIIKLQDYTFGSFLVLFYINGGFYPKLYKICK